MSNLFILLFLVAFVSCITIPIVWVVRRIKQKPFPSFKKALLGAFALLVISFVGVGATAAKTENVSPQKSSNSSINSKKKEQSKRAASESLKAEKESSSRAESARAESSKKASSEAAESLRAASSSAAKSSSEAQSISIAQSQSRANSESISVAASVAAESSSAAQQQSVTNATQVYTGTSQQIIGNSRSHIYHVPGQAGYHMNSANAVYFNSEADAIAAGYRKSER